MRLMIPSLASIVLSTAVFAMADDLTIVSTATRDGGPPEIRTSYISSDHVRMSQPDGHEMILDRKMGQMIVLDGKKKTYYVVTREDMDARAAMMRERMNSPEMKKAQERMKNLPPDAQKSMSAMGGMFAVEVKKLGTSRTVAGYKCENWSVTIGQFSKSEECLTNELKFPAQAWDLYRGYTDSMKSMMSAFGPMAPNMSNMQEQLKKLKGFPLAKTTTTSVMGRRSVTTSEVTSIKKGAIPASAGRSRQTTRKSTIR